MSCECGLTGGGLCPVCLTYAYAKDEKPMTEYILVFAAGFTSGFLAGMFVLAVVFN